MTEHASWENLNLNEVQDTPKSDIKAKAIEPSTQTLRLLGVKPDAYQPTSLAFDFVVDEGGYKNRRIFPTLPDPTKYQWAQNAAKHLATQLGVTQMDGESVMTAFNRVASGGAARIRCQITRDTFTRKDGTEGDRNSIQFFSAEAVA